MKRLATLAIAASALVAAAAVPSSALAKDRNHDRIPDRWEKRHHLSLHHDQAGRDQDHDGLKNRAEWKYGMDPRDKDSDDDGVRDGQENAGTVKSFADGVLTISLAKGGEVSGAVTDATEVECGDHHDAGDDDQGDDDRADDHGDDGPNHDEGDDHGDDDHSGPGRTATASSDDGCSTDALTTGAAVREADLELTGGSAVWREVQLLG
jgi:hypothetical protein